ncbi:MAG: glycosyltransferase family 2 protein [Bryobacterales bacterium]|nr:glycosyltransferase family 2 protein [Bryobacterales bacterium]MBV9400679.1 glycosyltransferase family 2 protein [Bryobacterales bacterium]
MTVAAVIPHWNRRDLLAGLLDNLKQQTRPFDDVIVVDNGSCDGSADLAGRAGARVLRLESNLGFAAAVNKGIQAASCKWVAILNNDVTLEAGWNEMLLHEAERTEAWFATGKALTAQNAECIDATFDEIARSGCAWRCGAGKADAPIWNKSRVIRIAPMTAALFRRSLFDEIGLLDEGFGSYLEDVDFGIRCALAGRSGIYVPQAVAYHRGSSTLGRWNKDTVRWIARNQVVLARKYLHGQGLWPIMAGQLLWGLVACRHGRALSYVRGKAAGLRDMAVGLDVRSPGWKYRKYTPEAVRVLLEESERTIFDLQRHTGFDWYWRIYFWMLRR